MTDREKLDSCKKNRGNSFNVDLHDRFSTYPVTDAEIHPNLRTTSLGAPKPPESDLGLCELRIDPNQLPKRRPASHQTIHARHNLPYSHLHHATERDSLEIHYHHHHHITAQPKPTHTQIRCIFCVPGEGFTQKLETRRE